MAIGQRIKYFRNRIGMTQKQLGEHLGFMGKTSDVRMAQYESEARVPKIDLVKQMAQIMAIGQRIKYFRNRIGMTQKQLGEHLGFMGKTSDVRMAQYESEARVPKIDLVKQMAQIFGVNTHALTVPDIDTHIGLMHTLFALEDMYGLKVKNVDGQPHLCLDSSISAIFDINTHALTVPDIDTHIGLMHTLFALEDMYGLKVKNVDGQPHLCLDSSISTPGSSVDEMLRSWMEQADKLKNGEISKEEYDEWRYKYPELDTYQKRAKVPSQELSDYLVQGLLDKKKK